MNIKLIIAGSAGFIGVALGAFGAHGLKNILSNEMLEIYKTGILYHLIHASVLLAISLFGKKELTKAFMFIAIGILLFSFSLYIYSVSSIKFFALITPFGGVSFLIGWGLIIFYAIKQKQTK
ncbi:MAG: DUF423 domain-containing protein [Ignavibacteriae bacterium]|nr:DUF423 domain-containing protein [Ignavibacteriota bacterium]NOG98024.1 DUF423 domain-containing protein [Ignavibacteriota bacterium]